MEKTRYLTALRFSAALFLFFLAVPAATAQSADWQGTFAPAAGREHLAGDALRVSLPADLSSETLQWLALELDNVDVTQLVSLDGMDAVNLRVAEQYIKAFSRLAKENNTVILPADLGNVGSFVASVTSLIKATGKSAPP